MKSAFVTGATGFIGRELVKQLVQSNVYIKALVRPNTHRNRIVSLFPREQVQWIEGDVGNPNSLAQAMQDSDVVFHAAAITDDNGPWEALQWTNVAGSENILKAARHAKVRRLIFLSCADVTLTSASRIHWDEKSKIPNLPVGKLAQSKQLAEDLLLAQSDSTCEVIALRPGYLWGRSEGEWRPILTDEEKEKGIELGGTGENFFSAAHVDIVTKAALTLAKTEGQEGRAFHVADTETRTAKEFFSMISSLRGIPRPRVRSKWVPSFRKTAISEPERIRRTAQVLLNTGALHTILP